MRKLTDAGIHGFQICSKHIQKEGKNQSKAVALSCITDIIVQELEFGKVQNMKGTHHSKAKKSWWEGA